MRSNKTKVSSKIFNELAARNVKKSAKDYFIYFFTLMLSVCLFYSFNSVSTQFLSLGLNDRLSYLSFSSAVLLFFSVIVCMVMGGLVVYANRFLLRRRKKEMGIYASLGMERRDLNNLLLKETLRIGVLSLAAGLVLGIFFAQILSLFTAKMTGISLTAYKFMFSGKAILLSVVFFGTVFFFVHRFNVKELKKMTLLDMLYAERKNEIEPDEKSGKYIFQMILSVVCIFGGYALILTISQKDIFKALGYGGALLIIGTFLFFTSVFKAMARILKSNKNQYYKGLNMFTAGQFLTKMKSESRTGAMIAVLLFLALFLMMFGPGMGRTIVEGIDDSNIYDATIIYVPQENENTKDIMKKLETTGFSVTGFASSYGAVQTYLSPVSDNKSFQNNEQYTVVGVNDYNQLLGLAGKDMLQLEGNEYALSYEFKDTEKEILKITKGSQKITIGNTELSLKENGWYQLPLENKNALFESIVIVVPQHVAETCERSKWILNFNFSEGAEDNLYETWISLNQTEFSLQTREDAIIAISADNILTTYLGIYLGITFLIAAGAVLALQQLSQSTDNAGRYQLLRKLGASQKDMKHTLTKQLKLYFGFPMIVAAMHSAVVGFMVFRKFERFEAAAMAEVIGFSVIVVFSVYFIYYIATYAGSRRILKV